MPQQQSNSGWTAVDETPAGWTPVEEEPHSSGASGEWSPESKGAKAVRVVTEPIIPAGKAEEQARDTADSPPTEAEAEFGAKHPTLGPLIAGAKRGLVGAYADTAETARSLTSPLAIASVGIGELAEAPGAVGKLAKAVSKLAGAGFGTQGAVKAAEGASEIAKDGPTPENTKKALSGIGQAVLGAATAGGKEFQDYATDRLPNRMINQLIKPSVADVKFGKNPGQAILDEKITGNSLPELGEKVYDRLHDVGRQIDTTLQQPQNAGKRIDISSSLKPIEEAKAKAVKDGDGGLYTRLVGLEKQLTMEWAPNAKGTAIKPIGPRNLSMSPYDAVKFKRAVGDSTKWTGNDPFEDQLNAVKGAVYGHVKDQINQTVPEVQKLNERYSNLVGAAKAIARRDPVAARNAQWSLSDIALGASGHIPLAIARKVASWPAVKTRAAVGLNSLNGGTRGMTAANLLRAAQGKTPAQQKKDLAAIQMRHTNPNLPVGAEP
jgi:hypothetical protein